ncbi:MAG: uracil-DNA glycosylase [Gammaproteobacteria bacterium]|nr:uracil-DNA glycosylase [Gammaproteobacteria bacterium]NNC98078.1 uracil-DNA glycosylase [Gammaproteobacteria bacterium]NNM13142.1 uracil-DNA glycosylase [Gammaproteobacteria bacterium]
MTSSFDLQCTACPRLAGFLLDLREQYPEYHNLPVAPFGDPHARFLIVGLAPGLHGANATGRPFTGDYAGELLYDTLYRYGFSNQAMQIERGQTHANDDLRLRNCRISNAVKCLPPQNKVTTQEVNTCNHFLQHEINALPENSILLALGGVAHKAILKACGFKQSAFKFAHNARHELRENLIMYDSYHCSRYNTNTKRLTPAMFDQVFADIKQELD